MVACAVLYYCVREATCNIQTSKMDAVYTALYSTATLSIHILMDFLFGPLRDITAALLARLARWDTV
jgi:hypothetical protein